jgi:Nucleotidyltransferase domain
VPFWSGPVDAFAAAVRDLEWIAELWIAGSAASGDYRPGISDLDLVAVVNGPVGANRRRTLDQLHRDLEEGRTTGAMLGCVYVERGRLLEPNAAHLTWTHGRWVQRPLSLIMRAELLNFGITVFGRPPRQLLPAMDEDDVRRAARAELRGYWAWAARRPWMWLNLDFAHLSLLAMARARYGLATGRLLTTTAAVDEVSGPHWLVEQVRGRRRGDPVRATRLRTAVWAWRDTVRTTAAAPASSTTTRLARSTGCCRRSVVSERRRRA